MSTSDYDIYLALRDKGEFRAAYAELRRILKKKPAWLRFGDPYVWCAELEVLVNDDISEARRLLDKASELSCRFMGPYLNLRGFVLWRMGERDEGIRAIEESVAIDPSITNLSTLGKVLSSEKDARAPGIWQRILEQDPNYCMAYIYLAREAANSGDQDKTLLFAEKAEELAKSSWEFSELGRLYQDIDEFQPAIRMYLAADRAAEEPKASLYAAIAACYFSLENDAEGQEFLARAIKHNPNDEYVKYVLEVLEGRK